MPITLPSDASRLLLQAELAPLQGSRFQPTGFPNLGAASYRLPNGTEMLLVESEQSVANRLEQTIVEADGLLRTSYIGLPYLRVQKEGQLLTTSLVEAHRLNSPYVLNAQQGGEIFLERLRRESGVSKGRPLDPAAFARTVFRYDVNSVLHGVFLEKLDGRCRITRALSGFIEASNVAVAAYGGVKNDRVKPSKESAGSVDRSAAASEKANEEADGAAKASAKDAKQGYGNVPFAREAFTAERITAFFSLDLAMLRSHGLGSHANALLTALGLLKIHLFLDEGLRLRTACDFDVREVRVTRPANYTLPTRAALEEALPGLIASVRDEGLFADPAVTDVEYRA